MYTDFTSTTWEEAVRSFLIHLKAVRARKTVLYYATQLGQLVLWAEQRKVPLESFGKRHMDEYLVFRLDAGRSQTTLHHDAICAKAFMKWCQRNDVISRSLLADYEIRDAPTPPMYMPTDEDIRSLLNVVPTYWDVTRNPDVRYCPASKRSFHRDRNYALILLLLDSTCRISEVLNLKTDDYRAEERQISIRESKGREPRAIPVSKECAKAIEAWLKVRRRIMGNVPKGEDAGWIFISETGGLIDQCRFLKTLKSMMAFAGIEAKITLHSLRRFSLNRLAKYNLLAAQTIAGHKDTKTTLLYTKIDPDFVRDMHDKVGVVRGILNNKRLEKKKRLV